MKYEDDVTVCKTLLDDLRVMKASLFEIVRLSKRYRAKFCQLIDRAMRAIECELLCMVGATCAVGATVTYT